VLSCVDILYLGFEENPKTTIMEQVKARSRRRIPVCWFSTAFGCTGITVQASLQRYRLHFGNPEISPTGFTIGVFHYTIGVFISISIGYFP